MVVVDMAVAARPDEIAHLEVGLLREQVRHERVARDVEGDSEEDVRAPLVELAGEPALRDVELEERVAGLERHPREVGDVPRRDDDAARVGLLAQQPDDVRDLVDVPSVRRRPAPPLHPVHGAEVAVRVRPLVPDRHPVLLEPADVRLAAEEPQELVGDRAEVHLLRRHEWEALGQVEAHLVAEHAHRPCPCPVLASAPILETWRMNSSYWVRIGRSLTVPPTIAGRSEAVRDLAASGRTGQALAYGRDAERRRHLPLHGHRGVDAARQAASRALRRRARRAPAAAARGVRGPRRIRGRHAGGLVLRRLRERARRAPRRGRGPARAPRIPGPTASRSRCGWDCTQGQAVAHDGATRASPCTAPPGSAPPGTEGRSSSPRRRRPCSRTRRRSCTSSCATSASSASSDLDRPVRLYQAAADGLPTAVPARPRRGRARAGRRSGVALAAWRRRPSPARRSLAGRSRCSRPPSSSRETTDGGLDAIQPNHVGVIDPQTNEIVAEVPVGISRGRSRRRRVGLGRQPRGPDADEDRPRERARPGRSRSTTGPRRASPSGRRRLGGARPARRQVSRVDPQFGRVVDTIHVAGTAFGSPNGSVAVGAGSVWAVVRRLDAGAHRARRERGRSTGRRRAPARAIVVAGRLVWVANSGDATVAASTRRRSRRARSDFNVGERPSGIAYGEGAIWVANTGRRRGHADRPDAARRQHDPVGDGRPPSPSVRAPSGWRTPAREPSRASTPTTNEVVETIEIGNAPPGPPSPTAWSGSPCRRRSAYFAGRPR